MAGASRGADCRDEPSISWHRGALKETLGREPAWNEQRAERELGKRLAAVEAGHRKPARRTFGHLADEFEAVALASKPRKRSTLIDYRATLQQPPAAGVRQAEDLGRLSREPERFERYAADKLAAGLLARRRVRNHLALLGLMFRHARRWRWVSESPVALVDPPRIEETEAETLTPAQVASVLKALRTLADAADKGERYWYEAARRMTVLALSTGLRRGELLGLRWRSTSSCSTDASTCSPGVRAAAR